MPGSKIKDAKKREIEIRECEREEFGGDVGAEDGSHIPGGR